VPLIVDKHGGADSLLPSRSSTAPLVGDGIRRRNISAATAPLDRRQSSSMAAIFDWEKATPPSFSRC